MGVIWQINMDRYGDESRAKGGRIFSIKETAELLTKEYKKWRQKPEIRVVASGFGWALHDCLQIPHTIINPVLISRIGNADIIKHNEAD